MSDRPAKTTADDVHEDEAPKAAPKTTPRGNEPPSFVRDFPNDSAELTDLVAAFAAGNYARVRRLGPEVARAAESDEVRDAARELVRRTEPDPLAKWFMIGAAGLLTLLALWFWSHGHGG